MQWDLDLKPRLINSKNKRQIGKNYTQQTFICSKHKKKIYDNKFILIFITCFLLFCISRYNRKKRRLRELYDEFIDDVNISDSS